MHPGDGVEPNNDMHIDDTLEIDEGASLMLVEGPSNPPGQVPAESPGRAAEGNLNDSTLE